MTDSQPAPMPDEITGKMWSAGRNEFLKYAQEYGRTKTFDESAVIADVAPAEIYRAMKNAALDDLQARQRQDEQIEQIEIGSGHREPCYYCGKPCNNFHGSPSKWAIPLCHRDDPGRVKFHHIGCVSALLDQLGDPGPQPAVSDADRAEALEWIRDACPNTAQGTPNSVVKIVCAALGCMADGKEKGE